MHEPLAILRLEKDGRDRQTGGRITDRYITRRGQRKKVLLLKGLHVIAQDIYTAVNVPNSKLLHRSKKSNHTSHNACLIISCGINNYIICNTVRL